MTAKRLPQFNPTLDKMGSQLGQAGASALGPILAGFPGQFDFTLNTGEIISSVQIVDDSGTVISSPSFSQSGELGSCSITFGTDTNTGTPAVRNHLVLTTNYGVSRRHFWVRDFPTSGGILVDNQNCHGAEALIYCAPGDSKPFARKKDFSLSFFPSINDEFFSQHEHSGNRWANTLRNYGGVETVQIWLDGGEIYPETDIADVHGYLWEPGNYGAFNLLCRFRAAVGSATYQDITGTIRVRQTACGGTIGA